MLKEGAGKPSRKPEPQSALRKAAEAAKKICADLRPDFIIDSLEDDLAAELQAAAPNAVGNNIAGKGVATV